jgi:hypothetical protein
VDLAAADEPLAVRDLSYRGPLGPVEREYQLDEVTHGGRDLWVPHPVETQRAMLIEYDLIALVLLEGHVTGEKNEENDAHGPHVCLLRVVGLSEENFYLAQIKRKLSKF